MIKSVSRKVGVRLKSGSRCTMVVTKATLGGQFARQDPFPETDGKIP